MNGLMETLRLSTFCVLLALVGTCEGEIRETFNESMGGDEDRNADLYAFWKEILI